MENAMRQTDNGTEQIKSKTISSKNQIELIDLLLVVWKWKLLIVGGALFFGLFAAIYGFNMTKVYRTEMVLRPGILTISEDGGKEYIETRENIKGLIDAGTFNNEIINQLKGKSKSKISQILQFDIKLPTNSSLIKISYLASSVEQGVEILDILFNQLKGEYGKIVQYHKSVFLKQLSVEKAELNRLETAKLSHETNKNSVELRIKELESKIDSLNSSTINLLKENTKNLYDLTNESKILSAILHSNTIQQNIAFANTYRDAVDINRIQKQTHTHEIINLENRIQMQLSKIDNIEFDIKHIENIQSIKPPSGNPLPIKPNFKLIILWGIVAGLALSTFLAFFLEYILKYRKTKIYSD